MSASAAQRPGAATTPRPRRIPGMTRRQLPALLTTVAMLVMLGVSGALEPSVLSINGLASILSVAVPLALAAQSQMIIMAAGDLDLGIGALVGLVTAIASTALLTSPATGALMLAGLLVGYALLAVLVHVRRVPSIIATLGASFVWTGLGLLLLPIPGGTAPAYLTAIAGWRPDFFPGPIVLIALISALTFVLMGRTQVGMRIRALGSNPVAVHRSGLSTLGTRVVAYVIAGALGVAAGLMLTGMTGAGDVNSGSSYMLATIAAVIIGGGAFTGGNAVPVGAALGAVTLTLIGVVLGLVGAPGIWQPAIQGVILLTVLGGRSILERFER